MAANNQAVVIGRAGNIPSEDIRFTPDGSSVTEVRLAVNRPGKDAAGNPVTDWINCQFWNKNAERVGEFVKKGDLISVTGSIRIQTWDKDGEKRQKFFIHGENFQMLESRRSREERQAAAPSSAHDYNQQRGQAQPVARKKTQEPDHSDDFALDDEHPPF